MLWPFGRKTPPAIVTERPTARRGRRSYEAAIRNRVTQDWVESRTDANREIRDALETVRANSREAERNSGYYNRALSMLVTGVCGSRGFLLKSLATNPDGRADAIARDIIETHWREFAQGRITIDGRHDLNSALQLIVRSWLRDGEVFVRKVIRNGRPAIQILEADFVPVRLDDPDRNIFSGVEIDRSGRPIAYHIATRHPGAHPYTTATNPETIRVPADEVLHLYMEERPGQLRGVPMGASALSQLRLLKGYMDAEMTAARMQSARPAAIEQAETAAEEFTGDTAHDDDEEPPIEVDLSVGGVTLLPPGHKMVWNSATHPGGTFDPFVRACIRSFASAMGVSYALLARDLGSVNYSSLRIENQHQSRAMETLQRHVVSTVLQPLFEFVLSVDLMAGRVGNGRIVLRADRIDKYRQGRWVPQPHPIVERTDIEDSRERIRLGVSTLTEEALRLTGRELDEIVRERKAERELLIANGLIDVLQQDATAAQNAATGEE